MEQRQLGSSGVSVSRIGLGGVELGPEDGEAHDVARAVRVIETAADHGIDWLDTSENYYDTGNEALIGDALTRVTSDILVATKVAPGAAGSGGGSGFRPEEVHAACRASLRRLRRERIDVYLLHWPDEGDVPLEETWGAMVELVDAGLVRAIGTSNYEIAQIERCHATRAVDVVEEGLSLVDHLDHRALFGRCAALGVGVTVYEPLASGVLGGRPMDEVRAVWSDWADMPFYRRLLVPGRAERSWSVVDGLRPIAAARGVTVAQLAIAWVLHQVGVDAAIAGSRSGGHVGENAAAAGLELGDAADAIDELIPLGPSFARD